ncbi:hypothetical protein ACFZDG_19515 [Kitasatospora xanthocidica]|uniref:hypothetical protein n=1 Tax=Kitasatospora xanthocidica TaxID=83382 RepID=UPI0036EADDF5
MYRNDVARQRARTLFNEGPRALGRDGFGKLVKAVVDFPSMRNRDGQQTSVEDFFGALEAAWAKSTRRRVTTILAEARGTRAEAADFLMALQAGDLSDNRVVRDLYHYSQGQRKRGSQATATAP